MKVDVANNATLEQTATPDEPLSSNVLAEVQALLHELRGLIHDHLQLAALEMRRAGENLVTMIISGVLVALLLISAWLGLLIAAVQLLIEQGMVASQATLLTVVFNLLIALLLCGVIRRKSHYLQFPATLRNLQPTPPAHRHTEDKLS